MVIDLENEGKYLIAKTALFADRGSNGKCETEQERRQEHEKSGSQINNYQKRGKKAEIRPESQKISEK